MNTISETRTPSLALKIHLKQDASLLRPLVVTVALLISSVSLPALADDPIPSPAAADTADSVTNPADNAINPAALEQANKKLRAAVAVTEKFLPEAAAQGLGDEWRTTMVANLMKGSETNFAKVSKENTLAGARIAAMEVAAAGPNDKTTKSVIKGKSLGSTTQDLVYVPFTPCRIVSTPVAGGGIVSGGVRTFSYRGSAAPTAQGGSCDPFVLFSGVTTPAALAANITVLALTTAFSGAAYLSAYPEGGSPSTAWLTYVQGNVLGNAGVLPINQSTGNFSVFVQYGAHVQVDVFGVFLPPQTTALECVDTSTSNFSLPANTSTFFYNTACPSGYTATTPYCWNGGVPAVSSGGSGITAGTSWCAWNNTGASAISVNGRTTCCRIPGR